MAWQRNWFFLMESLKITVGERRIIMFLLALCMIATGISRFGPSRTVYDQAYYEPLIAEFKRLSDIHNREHEELLARYYPKEVHNTATASLLKLKNIPTVTPMKYFSYDNHDTSKESPLIHPRAAKRGLAEMPDKHAVSNAYPGLIDLNPDSLRIEPDKILNKNINSDNHTRHEIKPVNVDTAGKAELMTLPGIGPVIAERIILYREEKGSIRNFEDLMNVSGVGPVTIENIQNYIIFD